MPPETYEVYAAMVRSPFGMVLCAGPTGSGKTTSLYATMAELNGTERNIMTIEDPVEYVVPSINQIQINEHADVTFASGLRAILRQDPDIILVGEIRDGETARIATQAALTGHFVMTSLHATDSTSALLRFLDMGIEPYIVASAVAGVLSQRLVRRNCEQCRRQLRARPPRSWSSSARPVAGSPRTASVYGEGCTFCAQTGYHGPDRRLRAAAHDPGDARAGGHRALARRRPRRSRFPRGRGPCARRPSASSRTASRPSPRSSAASTSSRDTAMTTASGGAGQGAAQGAARGHPARVTGKDLMHLSRQLAAFLRAGIPILDGLTLLGPRHDEP